MWQRLSQFVLGEKPPARLPERVRRSIAIQQNESEKLISWAQLILVVAFAILYALAPRTSDDTGFEPVPWVLFLYFSFTLIRLFFATERTLPEWFLMASIVMDMGLLMVLIWSFHIQYEQPAAFYLKAPTVLYVFLFISLRALRFDPRHIVVAGVTAVAGWAALVLIAVSDKPGTSVTRDYITYITTNSVLIGAEVDKIISMVLVTLVLAVSVLRARRIFENDMFASSAAQDLSRFVSPEVADRITHSDREIRQGDAETRTGSVIFTDIEGFTAVAERLAPLELSKVLNEYFNAVSDVIAQHGGVITQYQGDLMLITFNAVTENDNHAENAVKTALGIQDALRNHTFFAGVRLKTRCGVNSGDMVIGAVGAQDRLVFTVHGDDVNVAARLEAMNKQHGTYVLVGENTVTACGERFRFRPVDDIAVRGRGSKTAIFTPVR